VPNPFGTDDSVVMVAERRRRHELLAPTPLQIGHELAKNE
jgi:hypothetical protein